MLEFLPIGKEAVNGILYLPEKSTIRFNSPQLLNQPQDAQGSNMYSTSRSPTPNRSWTLSVHSLRCTKRNSLTFCAHSRAARGQEIMVHRIRIVNQSICSNQVIRFIILTKTPISISLHRAINDHHPAQYSVQLLSTQSGRQSPIYKQNEPKPASPPIKSKFYPEETNRALTGKLNLTS